MSRPKRWAAACEKAREGLDELEEVRAEYEEWRDNLPDNLNGSALAEKLDEVVGLDVGEAINLIDEAEAADLPLGFGRD